MRSDYCGLFLILYSCGYNLYINGTASPCYANIFGVTNVYDVCFCYSFSLFGCIQYKCICMKLFVYSMYIVSILCIYRAMFVIPFH